MNDGQVITNEEVEVLNAARTALHAISARSLGTMTGSAAQIAENIIFTTLNYASSYQDASLTVEQLHNRAFMESVDS